MIGRGGGGRRGTSRRGTAVAFAAGRSATAVADAGALVTDLAAAGSTSAAIGRAARSGRIGPSVIGVALAESDTVGRNGISVIGPSGSLPVFIIRSS